MILELFTMLADAPMVAEAPKLTARQQAAELIQNALRTSSGTSADDSAGRRKLWMETSSKVLALIDPTMPVVAPIKEALEKVKTITDDQDAVLQLLPACRNALGQLSFELTVEAPMPVGFPEPAPVGMIVVKDYPAYRIARTTNGDARNGMFMTLFNHIQSNQIPMTAPVEMKMQEKDGKLREESMAFLYQTTKVGKAGQDGNVEVVDIQPRKAVAIGMTGFMSSSNFKAAKSALEAWLKAHPEYKAVSEYQVLGYNSPFILPNKSYSEMQIDVEPVATK